MSDIKSPRTLSNRKPLEVPPAALLPAAPVTGGRIERRAVPRGPLVARHSAITRNLRNYANYKSWAEKIRSNWDPDQDPEV
ncbi:MAG TPA: hypothetical protein VN790_06125 [Steroidobacteraceae bacterium]|nr:hypothetical protein [Steroidobacteraceae bacterium]